MRKILGFLLPLSLCLSACSGTLSAATDIAASPVVDVGMQKATQALIVAENSYTVVASGVAAAARSGLVPAAAVPFIRAKKAVAVKALDAAYAARTSVERLRQVGILEAATEDLRKYSGDP